METFDLILDNCLDDLASGSAIDECLARHPEHAAQLRSFLQTAARFERVRNVRPSPAFKVRARAKLTLHMQAYPRRKSVFMPFLRLAMIMATLVLVFLSVGTALAQSALPGGLLYDWKRTSEELWRAAASDSLAVDLSLADRRVNEMISVTGDASAYVSALDGYLDVLARLAVQTDAESQARIVPVLESQQVRLTQAGLIVPELDLQLNPEPLPVPIVPEVIPNLIPEVLPELTPAVLPVLPLPLPTVDILPNPLPRLLP